MAELAEVTIYDIQISGVYKVQARTSVDAINKAKEYVEANADKLDYSWTQQTVYIEAEEG